MLRVVVKKLIMIHFDIKVTFIHMFLCVFKEKQKQLHNYHKQVG